MLLVLPLTANAGPKTTGSTVLRGQVFAHDTGLPIPGAMVDVYATRTKGSTTYYTYIGEAVTDANGAYAIAGVKAGHQLSVYANGYIAKTIVVPYVDKPLNVTLWKSASISGFMSVATPTTLWRVDLYMLQPDGSWAVAGGTSNIGYPGYQWAVSNLMPGTYKVAYVDFKTQQIIGWHSGAATIEAATPIALSEGQAVSGIDSSF